MANDKTQESSDVFGTLVLLGGGALILYNLFFPIFFKYSQIVQTKHPLLLIVLLPVVFVLVILVWVVFPPSLFALPKHARGDQK
jgi:hypothetical protein